MERADTREFADATRIGLILLCCVALLPTSLAADSLRVLSQNMNRLFDDVDDGNREKVLSSNRFQSRVRIAAKAFAENYYLPDVIALQEVENLNVLRAIADEIERRYGTRYRSVLLPGHDVSGINLGYLVRYRVDIRKAAQLFRDEIFGPDAQPLFSRPPLYLEACRVGTCLLLLNLHLRSMRGLDDNRRRTRVARKRLRQAEAVAAWANRTQHATSPASLLLLGDFNALTPGDEHVDVAGIIRGNPDNSRARLPGRDLVEPDLVDLSAQIPAAKRYSYIFRRQKQQLDYLFVNQAFAAKLERIAFGRINYRLSDHAGLYAAFRWSR